METNFKITLQDFIFNKFEIIGRPSFSLLEPDLVNYQYLVDFRVLTRSGSGSVTSIVSAVPNLGCNVVDYANFIEGTIAVVSRGDCTFGEKARLAEAASAAALIIYNTNQGSIFSGSCESNIPVYSISHSLGLALTREERTVRLRIDVETRKEDSITTNVLAETLGGNPNNVIVVGSHLDSVPAGAGINDNGSGTSTNLEIAINTFKCLPNPINKIRFAWWAAEELGLLGSRHYVRDLQQNNPDELNKITFNINMDMIGSPNFYYGIYNGSGASPDIRDKCVIIQREFELSFINQQKPYALTTFSGRSDYGSFIEIGIPAGGLSSGAETVKNSTRRSIFGGLANTAYDPCYHDYCDSFENVSEESLTTMASAAYHAVTHFANNVEPIQQISAEKKLAKPGQFFMYEQHPDAISIY